MSILISDFVGIIGVVILLFAYFLLQAETVMFDDFIYLGLNVVGSIFIIISLSYEFNLPAFLIESFWVAISLYGGIKRWRKDRQGH